MSLMTTISIGTTALFTFGSAIFCFCGFHVGSHGRSSTKNYIHYVARALYPLGHEGDEESGEVHVWNHSMSLRHPALVIRLGSFSGYGRSLSDSLCFLFCFFSTFCIFSSSLWAETDRASKTKILWHGACNQVPGTATTTTNYCGILAFSSGGCFFSFSWVLSVNDRKGRLSGTGTVGCAAAAWLGCTCVYLFLLYDEDGDLGRLFLLLGRSGIKRGWE